MKWKALFFIFLFHYTNLSAQSAQVPGDDIFFGTIPEEAGLSHSSILSIYQDSKGFLWFGTKDGLNRYDGYSFEVFRNDESDSTTLSSNTIWAITGDKNGDLWIGTDNGLNRYEYSSNKFHRYYKRSDNKGISNNKIACLFYDRKDRLWIGTEQGLDFYDFNTDSFIKTTFDGKLFNNRILSLLGDSYGNIWVGTLFGGLYQYKAENGSVAVYFNERNLSNSGNPVRAIFEDSGKNLWIGTRNGLYMYNPGDSKFLQFGLDIYKGKTLSNNAVRCIAEDKEHNILIATNEGLNILDPETGSLKIYNPPRRYKGGLNYYYIFSIFIDNAGTVWLGNYQDGINYYNIFNQQFRYLNPVGASQYIYGGTGPVAETADKLWIGTLGGGLFSYDKRSGTFDRYLLSESSFVSNIIKSLCIREDYIYIGDEAGVFHTFDRRQRKVVKSEKVSTGGIVNILPFNNSLFLCVRDTFGMRQYDPASGRISRVCYSDGDRNDRLFPFSICIEKENDSICWIGTMYTGLYRFNAIKGSARRYSKDPGNANSLSDNHVTSIHNERDNLWIGTGGGGLNILDKNKYTFKKVNEKDGLANRLVQGITADNFGSIWISTISGITKIDPSDMSSRTYRYGNGFPLKEPGENSCLELMDGSLCFGGNNGLVIFNPAKLISNSFLPPVVITGFSQISTDNKKEGNQQPKIMPGDNIRLKYRKSGFIIHYTALNYISPERNQYAYMLEGFDKEWNYVGSQRLAIYTNLEAGNYIFKVKASNNDGAWNENYSSLNIKVLAPAWLSWYAYIFYFCVICGLSFLLIQFIKLENSIRVEHIEKENMESTHQLRIRMFTNFSHELRAPLTLIQGPLADLMNRTDLNQTVRHKLNMIQQNSNRLLLLVNQLLDFRKKESGTIRLKASENDLVRFLKEVGLVFNDLAKKQNITFTFNTVEERIPLWFDRQLLEKVFFNLLSNAFKNTGEGGKVSIAIGLTTKNNILSSHPAISRIVSDELVEITVADTGKGIPGEYHSKIFDPFFQVVDNSKASTAGTGIGLSLSKGFVDLHKGIITVDSKPGHGASFRVILQKGRTHLADDEIITETVETDDKTPFPGQDGIPYTAINVTNVDGDLDPEKHLVLIVEDNSEVRNFIKAHLSDMYNVLTAENGVEGLRFAIENMPDLIITDIMMPEMDGLELCSKLKNDINTCHIPVIFLTAMATFAQVEQGFEVGSDDYLTKPFDPAVLKIKVNSLISNRLRIRKAFSNRFPFDDDVANPSTADKELLEKIFSVLDKHISDCDFRLEIFSGEMGMSRANFYRKIKALTNFAPNELIKSYRLKTALKLLNENKKTVSEISYLVGFSTPAYFSNCFKKTYGFSPSEYRGKAILKDNTGS